MKDYYYILGISKNSSLEEISSAYRKLSKKFHPDVNEGDKFFENRFKEILEAYETLSNLDKKNKYDELLEKSYAKNINVNTPYKTNKTEDPQPQQNNEGKTSEDFKKYTDNIKTNINKNVSETKSFIRDVWEDQKLFSVLFIFVFIFFAIVFLNMHARHNELTVGNLLLTPIISVVLSLIVAGILAGAINAIIDLVNRK